MLFMSVVGVAMSIMCVGITIVRMQLSRVMLWDVVSMGVICLMSMYIGVMRDRIIRIYFDKLIRMWMGMDMSVDMVRSFVDDDWRLVTLHSHTTVT